MFENIGWAEILVLVVAGLFILGPERLPEAARWLGKAIKQARDYATGARDHLRKEFGPEFDEIQQPLNDLRSLRSFNPRTAISRTLFSDDEPAVKPNGFATTADGSAASVTPPAANGSATNGSATNGSAASGSATNGSTAAVTSSAANSPAPAQAAPLASNERPPIDPDAT